MRKRTQFQPQPKGGKAPPAGDRLSRSDVAARLGVSLGAVRGWEKRGLIHAQKLGQWVYFDPEDILRFEMARRAGLPDGGGPQPVPRPPSDLDGLPAVHIRQGFNALASGMSPLELALRYGFAARHVRALVEEWKIIRDVTAQPACHRCSEQPATLCQECAALPVAVAGSTGGDGAAASGPAP